MPNRAMIEQARAGVFGKLPARGDFVRENLPRDFTDPWDDWWQRGLALIQHRDDWLASWLEAPVWHFVLPPGTCGRFGVLGLWLPSVDRAGRYFPLTLAAVAPFDWVPLMADAMPFLADLEASGRDALEDDLDPAELARRVMSALETMQRSLGVPVLGDFGVAPGQALWWTDGGTRVAPKRFISQRLPDEAAFAAMLDDRWYASFPAVAGNAEART